MNSQNRTGRFTNYKQNLDTLKKSYSTLKVILEPNLSEGKKILLNHLIDIITSQIQIFVGLLSTKELNKIYELLNTNNQNLSQKISTFFKFYENPKIEKCSSFSCSETKENELNKKSDQGEVDEEKIKQNQINYDTIIQKKNDSYDKDEEENNHNIKENKNIKKIKNKDKISNTIKPKTITINTTLNNKYNIIKPKLINNIYPRQTEFVFNTMNKYIKTTKSQDMEEINTSRDNNKKNKNKKSNNIVNLTENSSILYKKSRNKNKPQKTKYKNVKSKISLYIKNSDSNYMKHSLSKSKGSKISLEGIKVCRLIPKNRNTSREKFIKPILYDKNIIKVCHSAIDDYKELEHKSSEHIFPKKNRSTSHMRTFISGNNKRVHSANKINIERISSCCPRKKIDLKLDNNNSSNNLQNIIKII